MNMLGLNERLCFLVILSCSAFVGLCGRGEDMPDSCQVQLLVRRGTTVTTLPQQKVTIHCLLKHCGRPFNVAWCKVKTLKPYHCERVNQTENVTIAQTPDTLEDKLTSFLTFKNISVGEAGLYRCLLADSISHTINVSVSDTNQGHQNSDDHAARHSLKTDKVSRVWLPYFAIFCGIALPVVTLTILTILIFQYRHHKAMRSYSARQEPFRHVTPEIAVCNAPSIPVPQSRLAMAETRRPQLPPPPPPPPPPLMSARPQPAASQARQATNSPVYAVIAHRTPGNQTGGPNATAVQDSGQQYASISFT
ncbi:unnamed protein product [Ophioblennius macclurei]